MVFHVSFMDTFKEKKTICVLTQAIPREQKLTPSSSEEFERCYKKTLQELSGVVGTQNKINSAIANKDFVSELLLSSNLVKLCLL